MVLVMIAVMSVACSDTEWLWDDSLLALLQQFLAIVNTAVSLRYSAVAHSKVMLDC